MYKRKTKLTSNVTYLTAQNRSKETIKVYLVIEWLSQRPAYKKTPVEFHQEEFTRSLSALLETNRATREADALQQHPS